MFIFLLVFKRIEQQFKLVCFELLIPTKVDFGNCPVLGEQSDVYLEIRYWNLSKRRFVAP